jgi:hypothetical protein
MAEEGTMKEPIDDLVMELRKVRAELERWKRIGKAAFKFAGGKCIDGCRGACMCTCGFEHFNYEISKEQRDG